jgi:hypothetical protein
MRTSSIKVCAAIALACSALAGCISSSSPNPPEKTTVVVPQNDSGKTVVVCQDGTKPPCN